jgi:polar amino acid transport system substrate-binding protein
MISKLPKAGFKIGDMLFIEQVASAVTKGNQGLADAWSKALKELIADGTVGKISQKYFQEDVSCK